MKKIRIQANVKDLVLNEGQLDWLPKNPRQWTRDDLEKTKQSLITDPDFQEDNPIKVVSFENKFLVFAGNLRTTAARSLSWKTFEAMHYTPENEEDYETIRRRAILDNGSFGSWDYDILANDWDKYPLTKWGVSAWDTKKPGTEEPLAPDAGAEQPQEENLPEELQGVDLAPEDLEKIQGDDATAMERIIICYKKEEAEALGQLLGMTSAPDKVVYKYTENGLE